MKPFEFVLVIVSVIVGLGLTEFAIGMADLIQSYQTAIFYWPFAALIGLGFIGCLNYWGTVYKLRHVTSWSIPNIGVVFMSGMIFFIITSITFPNPNTFDQNYERHFNANIRIIFALLFLLVVFYMLESFLIRKVRKLKKYAIGIAFVLVILSGVVINNKTYQAALTVVLLIMQIYYMAFTKVTIDDKEAERT